MSKASPAISVTEIEGRGRALIASQQLKAGQIILIDTPILVYSVLPFSSDSTTPSQQQQIYCSNCFKLIKSQNPSIISCPSCPSTIFCSPNCRSISLSSSHSPWVCQALSHLRDALLNHHHYNHDLHIQARFLVAAYNLAVVSPPAFATLLSLQGQLWNHDSAHFLHSLISSLCPPPQLPQGFGFSVELTAALLAKDKLNAFGLMEPFAEDRERSVRAYGIYPKASFFNHDCLPNACRFDYLDSDSASNTDMVIRVIHDLPQGREICLSYFQVNLKYSDRQKRLRDDYGFTCDCDRCKVEANWSDEDEGGEAMDDEEEQLEECNDDVQMADDEEPEEETNDQSNDFPHAYFFIKYMCNRNNCWGTLAPLPPSDSSSNLMECNVCGNLTKEI